MCIQIVIKEENKDTFINDSSCTYAIAAMTAVLWYKKEHAWFYSCYVPGDKVFLCQFVFM